MKLRKHGAFLCLFLALALCLAGCSPRTAVTEESFTAAMEALGYTEQEMDADSQAQATAGGMETYRAYMADGSGAAVYRLYSDAAAARSNYASMIASMKDQDVDKIKEVDSATYNRAEYSASGARLVLVRTDGMLLTVNGTESDVESVLKQLGL